MMYARLLPSVAALVSIESGGMPPFVAMFTTLWLMRAIRQNMCQQFGRNLSLPPAPTPGKPSAAGAAGFMEKARKANESESLE